MITINQAFEIAKENSWGYKLSPTPYDLDDTWCFDYEGEEDTTGILPILVRKKDGKIVPFVFPDDEFRLTKAPLVEG